MSTFPPSCRHCLHALDAHHQVNDHIDCTDIWIDPLTAALTFCSCSRGCCLEERCPKSEFYVGDGYYTSWAGSRARGEHVCCICWDD